MQGYVFDRARDEIVCHFRRAPPGGGVWEEDEADCGTDKIAYVRYELVRPTGRATVHGLP